jgi:membrane peptidoglycan carboxypeptidase
MLEEEAFNEIHSAWQRVGYPFEELTPSYATAIGASGDRPAALAELTGILLNDGIRLPVVRFDSLHYAQGTPYETILNKTPDQGHRIFAPEIARVARGAMIGVVEGGTAGRLKGIYTDAEGKLLSVGGKTGTGDHQKQIWGPGGRLIESKFISRAATFTFFLGDRFFGVITAYVEGENSGLYHFTSSLPVQIVKFLKPVLSPLINNTLPRKEITKPVADVIIAENVKPVIKVTDNTKKIIPVAKLATAKVTKPLSEKANANAIKPLAKETTVKVTKPLAKETTVKVTKPLVKETTAEVIKPPAKVALTKNTKLAVDEKITSTDKNDSATRYYKYPTVPKLP